MRKSVISLLAIVVAVFMWAGCSGDDGATGPSGAAGTDATPGPIQVLILGSDNSNPIGDIALGLYGDGNLHPETVIDGLSVSTSTPSLAQLTPYDAVLFYTQVQPDSPAGLGDVLADYVDAGGRLVMMQGGFTTTFEIAGRILTAGYSPFGVSASALNVMDRMFWKGTIAQPPHKVFHGVNTISFSAPGNPNFSTAILAGTELAQWTNSHRAIAVNASNTIIGINLFPSANHAGTMRLAGNALHFLTGEL